MEQKTRFETKVSSYNPAVTVLMIDGFVDVNAAPEFEALLDRLRRDGRNQLLIDMSGVTYMSSAGVGVIVGSIQDFRELPGGDIKLFKISDKIMKILQSIGLPEMVDILGKEADVAQWAPRQLAAGFEHFDFTLLDSVVESGQPFRLRIEARTAESERAVDYHGEPQVSVSDGLVFPKELQGFQEGVWEGTLMTTGTGQVRFSFLDAGKVSELEVTVAEKEKKAVFPCRVSCLFCGTSATVRGMGIYRCRQCQEIFYVDAWAHVITLKAGTPLPVKRMSYKGVEMKINSDLNYLTSVRRFLAGLCEHENLPEITINEVVLAAEEALLNIVEHSHDFDPYHMIELRLKIQPKLLAIRIRDRGKPYDITKRNNLSIQSVIQKGKKGGLGGMMINTLMDRVTYRAFKHYNQLVMVKRLMPAQEAQAADAVPSSVPRPAPAQAKSTLTRKKITTAAAALPARRKKG